MEHNNRHRIVKIRTDKVVHQRYPGGGSGILQAHRLVIEVELQILCLFELCFLIFSSQRMVGLDKANKRVMQEYTDGGSLFCGVCVVKENRIESTNGSLLSVNEVLRV